MYKKDFWLFVILPLVVLLVVSVLLLKSVIDYRNQTKQMHKEAVEAFKKFKDLEK